MTQIAAIRLAPAKERGTSKWAAEGDVTANSLAVKKTKQEERGTPKWAAGGAHNVAIALQQRNQEIEK